jgi:hypothetical protein
MVLRTARAGVDPATATWLVNAAVERGREDVVAALVAEAEAEVEVEEEHYQRLAGLPTGPRLRRR